MKKVITLQNAINYLQQSLTKILKWDQFQLCLEVIKVQISHDKYQPIVPNLITIMVEKYHEIVNNQLIIQEEILIKLIEIISKLGIIYINNCINSNKQQVQAIKDILAVILWTAISHLNKNMNKSKDHLNKSILELIRNMLIPTLRYDLLASKQIYPKIYSLMIKKILSPYNLHIAIYQICLELLSLLIQTNPAFYQQNVSLMQLGKLINDNLTQSKQQQNCNQFYKESMCKLKEHLQLLLQSTYKLDLLYRSKIQIFLHKILPLCINANNEPIFIPLVMLASTLQIEMPLNQLASWQITVLNAVYCQTFISLLKSVQLDNSKPILTKLSTLAPLVQSLSEQHINIISLQFIRLFGISISHNMTTMEMTYSIPLPIIELTDSFSTFAVGISALKDSFNSQCKKVFVQLLSYVRHQQEIFELLRKIMQRMNINIKMKILSYLIENLMQIQYTTHMNLLFFYQYLQLLIIIYIILDSISIVDIDLTYALNLVMILTIPQVPQCAPLCLLQPSYRQQQLLLALSLSIIQICYRCILVKQQKNMLKLQFKVILYQQIFSNMDQFSYLIRLTCYHTLLTLASPNSIGFSLQQIKSTLIHRNSNNPIIMANVIKFCQLSQIDCEDLAQQYGNRTYPNSQTMISLVCPYLTTISARKCILAAQKWYIILTEKVLQSLYGVKMDRGDECDHFYANDADNVTISNALGVIILQLGHKWITQLQSVHKQVIIDIMIVIIKLDSQLIFFRTFFLDILAQLSIILKSTLVNNIESQRRIIFYSRLNVKICSLLALIPKRNYIENYTNKLVLNQLLKNLIFLKEDKTLIKEQIEKIDIIRQKIQTNLNKN